MFFVSGVCLIIMLCLVSAYDHLPGYVYTYMFVLFCIKYGCSLWIYCISLITVYCVMLLLFTQLWCCSSVLIGSDLPPPSLSCCPLLESMLTLLHWDSIEIPPPMPTICFACCLINLIPIACMTTTSAYFYGTTPNNARPLVTDPTLLLQVSSVEGEPALIVWYSVKSSFLCIQIIYFLAPVASWCILNSTLTLHLSLTFP